MKNDRPAHVRVETVYLRISSSESQAQAALCRTNVADNRHDLHPMTRGDNQQLSDTRRETIRKRGRSRSQTAANVHGRRAVAGSDEKKVH